MTNTNAQLFILIVICGAITFGTRSISFAVFRQGRTPAFISWMGRQLPGAVMAMLLVYCLKDISFESAGSFAPALIAVIATSALHVWRKQMMLSICGGTVVYMILLKLIG